MYKIKAFADLMGVSVRMLHHYDKIGLLIPDTTTRSGYRLYGEKSVKKMQQILLYKELDFSLEAIKALIHDHDDEKHFILSAQKKLLNLKKERLERIISLIDTMLKKEAIMTEKVKEALSEEAIEQHKAAYAQEAKERWGDTSAYEESQKRFGSYSKEKIAQITQEQKAIYEDLAALMTQGVDDAQVQAKVHEARAHISSYWYECTLEIFEGLGQMYVADSRFTENIDQSGKGLAQFLSDAIAYYVQAHRS